MKDQERGRIKKEERLGVSKERREEGLEKRKVQEKEGL
jgi:hypothetical protein